jgi:hypothetical protein
MHDNFKVVFHYRGYEKPVLSCEMKKKNEERQGATSEIFPYLSVDLGKRTKAATEMECPKTQHLVLLSTELQS